MLAWGSKVSPEFREKVIAICTRLMIEPDWLMACMAFESGQTFSPSVRNGAGSGACGLIQFMPSTAAALGTSIEKLGVMTAVQQLDVVAKYFAPQRGRLKSLADTYAAILWPGAIGKPDAYVLFDKADAAHPKRYVQNAGLDYNKDGRVTKAEAAARVTAMLELGRSKYAA